MEALVARDSFLMRLAKIRVAPDATGTQTHKQNGKKRRLEAALAGGKPVTMAPVPAVMVTGRNEGNDVKTPTPVEGSALNMLRVRLQEKAAEMKNPHRRQLPGTAAGAAFTTAADRCRRRKETRQRKKQRRKEQRSQRGGKAGGKAGGKRRRLAADATGATTTTDATGGDRTGPHVADDSGGAGDDAGKPAGRAPPSIAGPGRPGGRGRLGGAVAVAGAGGKGGVGGDASGKGVGGRGGKGGVGGVGGKAGVGGAGGKGGVAGRGGAADSGGAGGAAACAIGGAGGVRNGDGTGRVAGDATGDKAGTGGVVVGGGGAVAKKAALNFSRLTFGGAGGDGEPGGAPPSRADKRRLKRKLSIGGVTPLTGNNYRQLLTRVEQRVEAVEAAREKGEEQARRVEEKIRWSNALYKAQGVKIKDDPGRLRAALHRRDKQKAARSRRWEERSGAVERRQEQRQERRSGNLAKRRHGKAEGRKEAARRRGRVLPGDSK